MLFQAKGSTFHQSMPSGSWKSYSLLFSNCPPTYLEMFGAQRKTEPAIVNFLLDTMVDWLFCISFLYTNDNGGYVTAVTYHHVIGVQNYISAIDESVNCSNIDRHVAILIYSCRPLCVTLWVYYQLSEEKVYCPVFSSKAMYTVLLILSLKTGFDPQSWYKLVL